MAPTIVSINPSSGATGIPTNTTITVLFDQEIDISRLKKGGIILEGPSEAKAIGPGFLDLEPPETDEDKFLVSPALTGVVECEYTFQRVDGSGESVNYYDYGDDPNSGQIYRTQAVLTPTAPLRSLTTYTVYVVGDEDTTDTYEFGLTARTVYDPRKGPNLGNGEALFYGGYTGSVRQQFFIEITSSGQSGTAEYEWWTDTDPVHRTGVTSLSYRILKEGVHVRFPEGLNYVDGDTYSVWCDVPIFMDGIYTASFTTSSYEAEVFPAPSTALTGSSGSTSTATSVFSVESTSPDDRAALVSDSTTSITVTFSANVNSSTVTDSTVSVIGKPADDSIDGLVTYTETLTKSLSVSSTVLTITLDAGQIYDNNVIIITLDSTIADTDGTTLGADYTFFFGSVYNPFYAGLRHVQLKLGSLGNYYPEETVALAIWLASRLSVAVTPATIPQPAVFAEARRQFVACYAAWTLVTGGGGAGTGSVRVRLADLDVSRSEGGTSGGLDEALKECWEKWLPIVETGGDIEAAESGRPPLIAPVGVVKGDFDPDQPHFGRLWEIPRTPIGNTKVIYTGERRWYKTFLKRN